MGWPGMEDICLFAWLLKDLAWLLLCAPLGFTAAFAALFAEMWMLATRWADSTAGVRAHGVAELCWLSGNCIWFSVEVLYQRKKAGEISYPWYSGPLIPGEDWKYNVGCQVVMALWTAGLTVLFLYYVMAACKRVQWRCQYPRGPPRPRERPVFGCLSMGLYTAMFIVPWMCKDICWMYENVVGTEIFGSITLAMTIDYMRRTQNLHFLAQAFWILGNMTWALGEIGMPQYEMPFRIVAAIWLLVGCCILISVRGMTYLRGEVQSEGELQPLAAVKST